MSEDKVVVFDKVDVSIKDRTKDKSPNIQFRMYMKGKCYYLSLSVVYLKDLVSQKVKCKGLKYVDFYCVQRPFRKNSVLDIIKIH